ncbi:hypothetical protein FHS68_004413 [Dyadobacter arcticus]|uniref:Uncharacterized protein n=1 Tax=Dyadobacter arcticus TaxID=1078754 RepID=A0ABX0UQG3_9BACT|nr:hypothetical protein [Dyadobacter arcticus]
MFPTWNFGRISIERCLCSGTEAIEDRTINQLNVYTCFAFAAAPVNFNRL